VTAADQAGLAIVKLKFDADGLNPGQFIVVDLISVRPGVVPEGRGRPWNECGMRAS
jgi:hypothetical protein